MIFITLDSVSSCFSTNKSILIDGLAVKEVPRSGKPGELVIKFGIDCDTIARKVKEMLQEHLKK